MLLKPKDQKRVPVPAFIIYGDGREVCTDTARGRREYRQRTLSMRTRQQELCRWCGLWMAACDTTFDHENGRASGKQDDRTERDGAPINAALHSRCNHEKGSRRVPYPFPQHEAKR